MTVLPLGRKRRLWRPGTIAAVFTHFLPLFSAHVNIPTRLRHRLRQQKRILRPEWHFFCLGAGFLLFEVQIVSKIALLFGTTWLVNSFVISTLLLFIMAANWTVQKFPGVSVGLAYGGVFLFGMLAYFLPIQVNFFENLALRALCAKLILCSPAYFAGIIFARSYGAAGFDSNALGSNILGALCGGVVESLSFWTGIRSLVLVALVFYVLSALVNEKAGRKACRVSSLIRSYPTEIK